MIRLRAFGIRTATDLEQTHFEAKNRGELETFLKILPCSEGTPQMPRIPVILDSIKDEEWMANLRYWHDPVHLVEQTFSWPIDPDARARAGAAGEAPCRPRRRLADAGSTSSVSSTARASSASAGSASGPSRT